MNFQIYPDLLSQNMIQKNKDGRLNGQSLFFSEGSSLLYGKEPKQDFRNKIYPL
jgi:hypothetical protein